VDVVFEDPLPQGVRPDLGVDGVIEIERIDQTLRVGRPTSAGADRTIRIFRLSPDGTTAERVEVSIGRTSVGSVEILDGLEEGDVIILSDMSEWADHDRIRLR
jgi:multidrug efflux pump subunit AcrA (membrane-fusion protein)